MGATTNLDLRYPELGDASNVPLRIQQLAEDTDAALSSVSSAAVADVASLPVSGDFTGQQIYVEDVDVIATWTGAAWRIASFTQDGTDSITTVAATTVGKVVNFPITFAGVPSIVALPITSAPNLIQMSIASGASASSCTVNMYRSSGSGAVSFYWIATYTP